MCRLFVLSMVGFCLGCPMVAQKTVSARSGGAAPASVTICQLSDSPASLQGKLVVVHAYVKGGIPHGMILWDPNCPRAGVAVDYDETPDVRELVDAMDHHGAFRAGEEKIVFGDFTGVFSWDPDKRVRQRMLFIKKAVRVSVIDNPAVPIF